MTEPDRERVEQTGELLLAAASDASMRVTADLRIAERDAEVLLNYRPGALRQQRERGTSPPYYRVGRAVTYRILDLAVHLESCREP